MKKSTLLATVVLSSLVLASAWHVLSRRHAATRPGQVTIRIGHWLLQTGMREAFEEAAADYHRLHPNVTVEQVAVPLRVWPAWMRTQLVGGTAPDLLGLRNAGEDLISRYLHPITGRLDEANPYNAGTPLAGVPWRDTFVDGLQSMRALTPTTGEVHAVMLQFNTTRLFYNKKILRAVTGSDTPPADYAALRALGDQVERYNARNGRRLVPIAACGPYAEYLFADLLPSQTQKLTVALSPLQTLNLKPAQVAGLFLQERLTWHTPEVRASLALLQDVSTLLTPGFAQLQRDDALFTFLQGNAVMIYAGSWDYPAFVQDGVEVGICPLPLPTPDDPRYGRFVLGQTAESGGSPEGTFGIVRTSAHPEIALDFLRFLTSHRTARLFAERTYRMSAIAGIEPPAHAAGLVPRLDGEISGFRIDFSASFGGGQTALAFQRHLHALLGPRGNLDTFVHDFEAEAPAALRADLGRYLVGAQRNLRQSDAHLGFLLTRPGDASAETNWTRLAEIQHDLHGDYLRTRPLAQP